MKKALLAILPFALLASLAQGQLDIDGRPVKSSPEPKDGRNISMRQEVERSIQRGLDWLETQQSESGAWGDEEYPALTALALFAFEANPGRTPDATGERPEFIQKGYSFLLSKRQRDGGIYGRGLAAYNTSISMMTLLQANRPEFEPLILDARKFLVNQQSDFDTRGTVDNVYDGGVGYGGRWAHSDLSNTHLALEALYHSRHIAAKQEDEQPDLDWEAAQAFLSRCQNLPETNSEEWASDDPANRGGFIYFPGSSMAGEQTLDNGRTALRSYGSMSYAGLLSLIYAEMEPSDPRVVAVMDWLKSNYTLEENPGMGQEGLFYYYLAHSKALHHSRVDTITLENGEEIKWREALAKKLFTLQQADGSWINENGRWWEKDPVLVTSYAVQSLVYLYQGL